MKIKRIFALLLCVLMVVSIFTACGKKDETDVKEPTNSEVTDTKPVEQPEEEIPPADTEPVETEPTVDPEEIARQEKEACENALKDVKVELLSREVVDYENGYINGFLVYSEDYEKATILTIGIKFPDGVYYDYYKGITIAGETATGKDENPVVQTTYDTGWIDNGKNYALMIVRLGGEVDPAKADIQIKGENDVVVNTKFENDGAAVGFDNAKTAFADKEDDFGCGSSIVKLKGRHYIIIRRFNSSTGWGGGEDYDCSTATKSYVLIPLDGGFTKTLTKDDVKLTVTEPVANTEAQLLVNESGRVDASSLECQTTIEVEVIRTVVEPEDEEGSYSDEVYDKIDDDQDQMFKNVILEIDDGDGNIVTLKMS